MRVRNTTLFLLIFVVVSPFLVNCSNSVLNSEDNTYLTPIPQSTLSAFQEDRDYPIDSKLEAVIASYSLLGSSNLLFTQETPKVISAEKMELADAKKFINYNGNRPDKTQVWFVVFEGSWQAFSPDGGLTPLESGCIYVILEAKNFGYSSISARSCLSSP